jgi:hypothetical protein
MSYQDGRRVEALEAAVRELQARAAVDPAAPTIDALVASVRGLRERVDQLEAKLRERPALTRRHA